MNMQRISVISILSIAISFYSLIGFSQDFSWLRSRSRPKLIIFSADWCAPCKKAKQAMQSNIKLKRIVQDYDVVKYNFDVDKEAKEKYNVNKVPTFIVEIEGEELRRQIGFTSPDKLINFLD